jgi:hypothetical protein
MNQGCRMNPSNDDYHLLPEAKSSGADPQADAAEKLAEKLHWITERLEQLDEMPWSGLDESDRDFYRRCIRSVLAEADLVRAALDSSQLRLHKSESRNRRRTKR